MTAKAKKNGFAQFYYIDVLLLFIIVPKNVFYLNHTISNKSHSIWFQNFSDYKYLDSLANCKLWYIFDKKKQNEENEMKFQFHGWCFLSEEKQLTIKYIRTLFKYWRPTLPVEMCSFLWDYRP